MKKRLVFTAMIALFVLGAQTVFAADYNADFVNALNKNNLRDIENLLSKRAREMNLAYCMYQTIYAPKSFYNTGNFNKANCLDILKLLVRYGADVNRNFSYSAGGKIFEEEYPLQLAITERHSLAVIQFLLDSGANPNLAIIYDDGQYFPPIVKAYSRDDRIAVMNLLFDRGVNGQPLLQWLYGYRPEDNQLIQQLISRGVQIRSVEGAIALRKASELGKIDIVKLLVENGVNVNARDDKTGATAASIAYDKGEMDIYDYLKANGARDFEPRQATAQPAAPAANTYVQPAPAQSGSSSSGASSSSSGADIGRAIVEAFTPPLDSGTYGLTGTQAKIRITGIAKSGILSFTNIEGKTVNGTYSIDGNRMTIQAGGYTYVYTITSKTSFSGHGETWVRTGF
jgi:ankyrin repeat protein